MNINKLFQLAVGYYQTGNLREAESLCRQIIRKQPKHIDTLNLLGLLCYSLANYDSAIGYINKALELNPSNAEAYTNLGNAYRNKGQLDKAITSYEKAIKLKPHLAMAYNNLGSVFQEKRRLDEAVCYYQKALELAPNLAEAYNNMGIALREKGQFDKAITYHQKAISLNPNSFRYHFNLGNIFHDREKLDEAISFYQKALQLNPNFADAYNNIGNILFDKRQLEEAMSYYQKALELDPNLVAAYINIGIALQEKGQLDKAISCFQKAIGILSNNPEAHSNMSRTLLLSGNFKEGWKEYEWRWESEDYRKYSCFHRPDDFSQPILNGLDIEGHTVLIYAEQGLGDEIQFIRYAPLVAQHGAKVIVECHKELSALLQSIDGVKQFIVQGEPLPGFDIQCPLLTLPLIFNTTLENIPSDVPYISANSTLIQKWKDKVQDDNSKLKIGLVCQANPKNKKGRNRSIPFAHFSPFAKITDITFYSLQKGKASEQAENLPVGMKFVDLMEEINDFSDTAALIENLDLIISVDTSVAHLAGALGKPIWTLLPFAPDWRWMLNREDSPWYPTMRLFRQPSPGDWESVIAKIKDELLKLLGNH